MPTPSNSERALRSKTADLQKALQNHQKSTEALTKCQLAYFDALTRALESTSK
jgi:hypothetical protein